MKTKLEQYHRNEHGIYKQDIDSNVIHISDKLISNGYQAFLVGGCIRDILLEKKPKDYDIVTDASPDEICNLFKNARIIGKRFKIVHVYFSDKKYIEVTTFRSDVKKKNNKKNFIKYNGTIKRDNVYGTISQDAFRRDFTINSLFLDLDTEIIHDYVDGIKDIKNKILRLIKKPSISYQEDPVRMLRAIRFKSKLNLKLSDECEASIKKMAHMINNVSPFRLFDEVIKIMHSGYGFICYKKLRELNLFEYLFPFTNNILQKEIIYDDFFSLALKNTDHRIKEGSHVNPSFIYAVFLWPYFQELEKKYSNKKAISFDKIFRITIESQAKYIAIPEFFQSVIHTIWSLQGSFLNLNNQNVERLLKLEKFRVAYDFLYIRSLLNQDLKYYFNKWCVIQKSKSDNNR